VNSPADDMNPSSENTTAQDGARHLPIDFSFVLASSVHDMKNSLGMLLNTLAAMVENSPPKDEVQAKFFSTLEYEAARINTESVQLLSLYRMDEHQLAMEIDEHHVVDVIDEQLARNHTLFKARNIELQLECDSGLVWYFDSEMLGGVLNNVLVNCARYSRSKLLVSATVEAGYLCISVADDGAGYPDNMLVHPVASGSVSFSSGSTRLGLLFARKVMELHKSKQREGYLSIANQGPLGGGVLKLYIP
jgi:signal transduction histidine kinase